MIASSTPAKMNEGKRRKVPGVKVVEKDLEYSGLCLTCIFNKECGFYRDVARAVLECDEFRLGSIPGDRGSVESGPPIHGNHALIKYRGLCVNCDLRQACQFPKPVGGVWHCEEYV